MKIGAIQVQPDTGNIEPNIVKHLTLIDAAVEQGVDLVVFPELSLTGYEPELAQSLAIDLMDSRLDVFQQRSDRYDVIIGVGLPLATTENKVQIGMAWFAPDKPRRSYAKQQLHADELPYFVAGNKQLEIETPAGKAIPAICYESLQPDHASAAAEAKADIYLASVAKPTGGLVKGMLHYPAIARQHNMYVIMADAIGPCDDFISVGQSAAWNNRGELLLQMGSESEGFLLVDTVSGKARIHELQGA